MANREDWERNRNRGWDRERDRDWDDEGRFDEGSERYRSLTGEERRGRWGSSGRAGRSGSSGRGWNRSGWDRDDEGFRSSGGFGPSRMGERGGTSDRDWDRFSQEGYGRSDADYDRQSRGGGYGGAGGYGGVGGYGSEGYRSGGYSGGGYSGGGYGSGADYNAGGYGGGAGNYGGDRYGNYGGGMYRENLGFNMGGDNMRLDMGRQNYGRGATGQSWGRETGVREGWSQSDRSWRRGPHAGRGPKGWKRSDERIREDVNEALARDPDLDATSIEVAVANGEVTIRGVVEDRQDKRLAEDIAEEVFGVEDVHNELKVRHGAFARLTGEKAEPEDEVAARQSATTTQTIQGTSQASTATATKNSTRSR